MTYEFDADGTIAAGRVAIPFAYDDTATEIGSAAVDAISLNPPPSLTFRQRPSGTDRGRAADPFRFGSFRAASTDR